MTRALVDAWTPIVGRGLVCAQSNDADGDAGPRDRRPRLPVDGAHVARKDAHDPAHILIDGVPAAELVAQLRGGSRAALATLYGALHTPLWRMAVVLTRSRDRADEIVQDVFLALWQRHEQLPHDLDVRAYAYAAVRNLAKQRARHDGVVMRFEHAAAHDSAIPPAMGQAGPDAATHVESADFYAAFSRALRVLKDRERIALRLRLEDEFTFDQIGEALGISKMGAHKLVARAEQKIRELLADYRE